MKALRDIRQKQQQMAAMSQMTGPIKDVAQAGKALGETDVDNVQKLIGQMTGQ